MSDLLEYVTILVFSLSLWFECECVRDCIQEAIEKNAGGEADQDQSLEKATRISQTTGTGHFCWKKLAGFRRRVGRDRTVDNDKVFQYIYICRGGCIPAVEGPFNWKRRAPMVESLIFLS
jgi:hypothetical protein